MLNIHVSHISLIGGDNIMDTNELISIVANNGFPIAVTAYY